MRKSDLSAGKYTIFLIKSQYFGYYEAHNGYLHGCCYTKTVHAMKHSQRGYDYCLQSHEKLLLHVGKLVPVVGEKDD